MHPQNRRAWLRQMIGLLLRSRPVRGLIVAAALAAALPAVIAGLRATTQLPPEREAANFMGAADVTISPYEDPRPPGVALDMTSPYRLDDAKQVVVWTAPFVPLTEGTTTSAWDFYEGAWPSVATDTRVDLISGRWPQAPGECAATSSSPELHSPVGRWQLTVVGRIEHTADPRSRPSAYCAPGTWARFQLADDVKPFIFQSVQPTIYVTGDPATVEAQVLAASGDSLPIISTRDGFQPKLQIGAVLSDIAPWLVLSAVAALGAGAVLGRWVGALRHLLVTLGGRGGAFSTAGTLVTAGISFVVALIGGAGAQVIVRTSFPLLSRAWHEAIVPNSILPIEVLITALIIALAAAIGVALTARAWTPPRSEPRPATARASRRESPRRRQTMCVIAVGAWLAAIVTLATLSDTGMVGIAVGAAFFAVAASLTAILVVGKLVRTQRSDASPQSLAALWASRSGRSGVIGGLSVALAIMMTVAITATSYGYARYRLALSEVPPGVATIRTSTSSPVTGKSVTTPESVIQSFVDDVGITSKPIPIFEVLLHPNDGSLWGFQTIQDAEAILGTLSSEDRTALERGAVLLQSEPTPDGTLRLRTGDTTSPDGFSSTPVRLPFVTYATAKGHEFQVAGFHLLSALPPNASQPPVSRLVYTGLTPEQDQRADQWPDTTGLTAVQVRANHPATTQLVLTILAISMVGFAVVILAVVAGVLRGEARSLRPIAAGLFAMGIPPSWPRKVLLWLTAWLVAVPVLTSFAVAAVLTIGSLVFQPRLFTVAAVPWAAIVVSGALIIAAGCAGALLAGRRVQHRERLRTLA